MTGFLIRNVNKVEHICMSQWQRRDGERTAFEIEDRRPVVRAASLHPEPDVKTTIESTVCFEPISLDIAVVLT